MHTCDHVLDSKQFLVVALMFWEAFSNISWNAFADNDSQKKWGDVFHFLIQPSLMTFYFCYTF